MEQLEQQQPAGVGRRQSLAEQWFRTVRLRRSAIQPASQPLSTSNSSSHFQFHPSLRRSDRLAEQGIGVRSEELGRKQFDHDMFRQPPSIGDEEEEDMESVVDLECEKHKFAQDVCLGAATGPAG